MNSSAETPKDPPKPRPRRSRAPTESNGHSNAQTGAPSQPRAPQEVAVRAPEVPQIPPSPEGFRRLAVYPIVFRAERADLPLRGIPYHVGSINDGRGGATPTLIVSTTAPTRAIDVFGRTLDIPAGRAVHVPLEPDTFALQLFVQGETLVEMVFTPFRFGDRYLTAVDISPSPIDRKTFRVPTEAGSQ